MGIVVGILPNHDAVTNLAYAIKAAGLDNKNLTVISSDGPIGFLRSTEATFVRKTAKPYEPEPQPPARISGDTEWRVPGDEAEEIPGEYYAPPELEALSELRVPDSRTDKYTRAIDDGRWVAGFNAGDQTDAVRTLFIAAHAQPVDVF